MSVIACRSFITSWAEVTAVEKRDRVVIRKSDLLDKISRQALQQSHDLVTALWNSLPSNGPALFKAIPVSLNWQGCHSKVMKNTFVPVFIFSGIWPWPVHSWCRDHAHQACGEATHRHRGQLPHQNSMPGNITSTRLTTTFTLYLCFLSLSTKWQFSLCVLFCSLNVQWKLLICWFVSVNAHY